MAFDPNFDFTLDTAGIIVLLMYAGGILAYGLVVNMFYQILSHRVMLGRREGNQRRATRGRAFLYILLFPAISFGFFLVLSSALLFLSDETRNTTEIFTIAMAVVLAIRLAAYVSEPTSHDVAKMLPLGLLGVFLVNNQVTGLQASINRMADLFNHVGTIAQYFAIVVFAEFFLRGMYSLLKSMRKKEQPPAAGPARPPTAPVFQQAPRPPARP